MHQRHDTHFRLYTMLAQLLLLHFSDFDLFPDFFLFFFTLILSLTNNFVFSFSFFHSDSLYISAYPSLQLGSHTHTLSLPRLVTNSADPCQDCVKFRVRCQWSELFPLVSLISLSLDRSQIQPALAKIVPEFMCGTSGVSSASLVLFISLSHTQSQIRPILAKIALDFACGTSGASSQDRLKQVWGLEQKF